MKQLKAITLTEAEKAAANAVVAATRAAIRRFKEENAGEVCYGPIALVQITETEENWRLMLTGRATGHGRTLGDALAELANNSDAAFLRERARACREKAEEMERQAERLERGGEA